MDSEFPKHKEADVFYRLADHPVYMATVTKSGCTFLKNLFYFIDQDELHPLGDRIHSDESLLVRASIDDLPTIENSPYVYMVIRNPIDRFYSLYYDKIVNPIDTGMYWFRDKIGYDLGMRFDTDLSLAEHRENTAILIEFIDKNIKKETDFFVDFHWRPQRYRYRRIKDINPILIPLDQLNKFLPQLLADLVPNIEAKMAAIQTRNQSYKPFSVEETQSEEVVERIREIYKGDFDLYRKANRTVDKRIKDASAQKG